MFTRLVVLARERHEVWEPGSGAVSEQFIKDMTPEVFTSAVWQGTNVSMKELLDVVEQCRRLFVQSPQLYGAMSFVVEEVGLREPTLRHRARDLLGSLRDDFVAYHERHTSGFQAPPPAAGQDPLNPLIAIHGGDFVMGANEVFATEHRIRLSNFAIQQHEVTKEEYRRFDPSHSFPDGKERRPVDSVNWYEAQAYAAWLGGSLPTEAQWEFTARGKQRRKYPWGDGAPTRERANFLSNDSKPESDEVGSHPRGATSEGVQDLAGNVWEWCRDWFEVYPATADLEINPLGPLQGTGRVLRGGSYFYDATFLRAAVRNNDLPGSRSLNVGFRVGLASGALRAPD
jgi:formylglycine-generating enzyme required for sulfatase activity